ncbi:MAG: hypothetical protein J5586_06695 [Clostridia bacterium]|nr:hypothetical protein [Clostridia bacterium]
MKRTLVLLLAALMVFGLFGCRKSGSNVIDIIADNTREPASDPTDAPATADPTDEPETTPEITPEPTADPALTPEPTAVPELPAGQLLWLNTMSTDLYGVSQQEAEAWFADAVFVGDSIMLGWKNYNNSMLSNDPSFFGPTRFLCEGSYGAGHALEPVSETSLHPLYQGEQHLLWDSIRMMGANKVFICFGLNDVAIYGVEGTASNFETLCGRIEEQSPGVKIYLISSMYLMDDSHQRKLTNENLRILNGLLRELCQRKGYKFVDIASHLVGEDGYLKREYCSDPDSNTPCHHTAAAYKIWAQILRSVAAHDIKWGY